MQLSWLAGFAFLIFAIIIAAKYFRAVIYDILIVPFTGDFYKQVLLRLPDNSILVDVGIGTGTSLVKHKHIIVRKNLQIFGVDYDADYVHKCQTNIEKHFLTKYVSVVHQSIYDYRPPKAIDAAYFSMSLMLMPDSVAALTHCISMFKVLGNFLYF